MLEKIIDFDKQAIVFLNNLGSETYDGLWLIITKQVYWTPFFLFIFYLLQKKIGWKKFGLYILFTAVLILICDQTVNLFKYGFERLRPINDEEIKGLLRIVKTSKSFSFFSGHATNSMASTVFMFMILRKYYKHAYLLFLFPLIFAYSRIYLGLHFPTDILTGYVFGATMGFVCYKLYNKYVLNKILNK
ncbi:phosphatase PAP2 family protein [Flavobacterium solisilvae]|uniref:Phosphatase PAP2 family protein n=1 Tax=Flavobacterium solisilvae TaxID=1852019 RepID=A0ABX1QVR2_9FLAO|nr:phosphatase PAP2 family protein [Flavobacterium solisilvae]NMH25428.1 phosphatase PAP2 family protein [Flavobacterium solisilvae]